LNADILEGYETAEKGNRALFARLEALADIKYTYVVSCQSFALQKAMNDPRYKDTIELMTSFFTRNEKNLLLLEMN
jgi:callose synthase